MAAATVVQTGLERRTRSIYQAAKHHGRVVVYRIGGDFRAFVEDRRDFRVMLDRCGERATLIGVYNNHARLNWVREDLEWCSKHYGITL